jgi:hypothetical protein
VPKSAWLEQMRATDFSGADDRCRLVLSWPGAYNLDGVRSGHRMLAGQIRALGLQPPKGHTLEVEYNVRCIACSPGLR